MLSLHVYSCVLKGDLMKRIIHTILILALTTIACSLSVSDLLSSVGGGAEDYLSGISEPLDEFISKFQRFTELHQQFSEDRSVIMDPEWRDEATQVLQDMKALTEEMISVEGVPAQFAQSREFINQLGLEVTQLMDTYIAGIESGDADMLSSTRDAIDNIGAFLNLLKPLIEAFQ